MIDWDLACQLLVLLQLMLLSLKCQVCLQLLMRHERDRWRLVLIDFLFWGLRRVRLQGLVLLRHYLG